MESKDRTPADLSPDERVRYGVWAAALTAELVSPTHRSSIEDMMGSIATMQGLDPSYVATQRGRVIAEMAIVHQYLNALQLDAGTLDS